MNTREQGLTGFISLLWLFSTLGVIQLWLISTAMDALRSGTAGVLMLAATASLALLLVNGFLLRRTMGYVGQLQAARAQDDTGTVER